MDNKISNQSGSMSVSPVLLQTQLEVDTSQKLEEIQLVDRTKKIDKSLVAGLVRKSNRILATISTHRFPFDFFPDTINIEEGRITLITRKFFLSSRVHSIDIKDISNIFINTAPFFAQLIIISKTFKENEIRLNYLHKDEAVFVRRMIEGLRAFESKQIDTSVYSKEELIAKLKELSMTEIVT